MTIIKYNPEEIILDLFARFLDLKELAKFNSALSCKISRGVIWNLFLKPYFAVTTTSVTLSGLNWIRKANIALKSLDLDLSKLKFPTTLVLTGLKTTHLQSIDIRYFEEDLSFSEDQLAGVINHSPNLKKLTMFCVSQICNDTLFALINSNILNQLNLLNLGLVPESFTEISIKLLALKCGNLNNLEIGGVEVEEHKFFNLIEKNTTTLKILELSTVYVLTSVFFDFFINKCQHVVLLSLGVMIMRLHIQI
jgi:hypothetical protein